MEAAGLIEALPAEDRRHPYKLTPAGLDMLSEQLSVSARLAEVGLGRLAAVVRR